MKRQGVLYTALAALLIGAGSAGAGTGADTTRISVKANHKEVGGASADYPAISGGGRYTVYETGAQLVGSDDDSGFDVYLYDRERDKNRLVSVDSSGDPRNAECAAADISPNGRYVSFGCNGELSNADNTTGTEDVYRRDVKKGKTVLISLTDTGAQLSGVNDDSEISGVANNGLVAWQSYGAFVTGDSNTAFDTFVRDPERGTTVRASVGSADQQLPNGVGSLGTDKDSKISIAGNGRYVAFSSPDVATDDPDFGFAVDTDVFVRDLERDKTIRASLKSNGDEADSNDNANSRTPSISVDGRYVAFASDGSAKFVPDDDNNAIDIYVRDVRKKKTFRVSVKSNGDEPAVSGLAPAFPEISANGRYVVWDTQWNFGNNGGNLRNVYRHDIKSKKTILVSRASNGEVKDTNQLADVANSAWVAFSSMAKNTNAADDGNDFDVFLRGPLD
jgi:Tol biopolymer transport system component